MAIRDDVLSDAMIATEKEIAAGAWDENDTGEDADASGDRSLEQQGSGLEGQHEANEDDESEVDETEETESEDDEGEGDGKPEVKANGEDKSKPDAKPEAKPDPKAEPEIPARVPGHRLREQTERASKAEAERDELRKQLEATTSKHASDVAALNARFDQVLAGLQRQPAKPGEVETKPAAPVMPEVLEDPKGYHEYIRKDVGSLVDEVRNEIRKERFERSLAVAHARHGDAFVKAFEASNKLNAQNPEDLETGRRIYNAPDPGEALVAWFKRGETLREVGDDPAKYRERVAQETRESLMKDPDFRKQLLEELKAEAREPGHDGRPRHQLRLPPNLNGAAGRGAASEVQTLDGSEQGVADAAWR